MINRSIKLEVICNDLKGNKERLNYFEKKYFKTPINKRVHMSKQGELAFNDTTAVDLLKQSIDFDSALPSNTNSYSLCINSYNEYISKYTSVSELVASEQISTIGNNLYAYDDSNLEDVIIEDDDIDYMLKLFSKYIKAMSSFRSLNKCENLTEEERLQTINKIKDLYNEVTIRTINKNNNKKLILK